MTQRPTVPAGNELLPKAAGFVAASWQRSLALGLKRHDRGLFNHVATKTHSRRVECEGRRLISHVSEELAHLYKAVNSSRWVALCTNASGEVVCWAGDKNSAPRRLRVLMQSGRSLSEAELGTTAPGCVLADGAVAVVTREEHFLLELKEFFCASAPVTNTDGSLAGVIDISGLDVEAVPLAAELVSLAARRTENKLLSTMTCAAVLRFHCDERLLDTPFEGLIAVDEHACICGANRAARHLLAAHKSPDVGLPLQALFESDLGEVLRRARPVGGAALPVRLHSGTFGFLNLASRAPAHPSIASLRAKPVSRVVSVAERPILIDPGLRAQYARAGKLLKGGSALLIQGPGGSGKETIARALHADCADGRTFTSLHCGQFSELALEPVLNECLESLQSSGNPLAADSSNTDLAKVLFLDEVAHISLQMQSVLVKVLERCHDLHIRHPMSLTSLPGVIGATKFDLQQLVARNEFRSDLYYLISGNALQLPGLCDRPDMPRVVEQMLRQCTARSDERRSHESLDHLIDADAFNRLLFHTWPGNLRELAQVLQRLVTLAEPKTPISEALVLATVGTSAPVDTSCATERGNAREAAERRVIQDALVSCRGNLSAAARMLGLSRGTLYKRLKRFSLSL